MALGALGLAGARRQRRRRTLRQATAIPLAGGFAAPTGEEQLYEAQATDLASTVLAELRAADGGFQSTRLVGAYAGRSGASLLLFRGDEHATTLSQTAKSAGARVKPMAPGLYAWEQSWPPVGPRPLAAPDQPQVKLVPLGLAADHRVLYAERSAAEREADAAPPRRPPLWAGAWFSALPRPEPLFLPPPVSAFTVAHARRSASSSDTPRSR